VTRNASIVRGATIAHCYCTAAKAVSMAMNRGTEVMMFLAAPLDRHARHRDLQRVKLNRTFALWRRVSSALELEYSAI
jgi:hypothetical protein